MNKGRQALTILLLAVSALMFLMDFVRNPDGPLSKTGSHNPIVTTQAVEHILYGNDRGGGHMYGQNKPCKSEFPASWDKEEIIRNVTKVAANDNLDWEQQDNGYYVAEDMVEGINVRVVLSQNKGRVITSYPTNVKRNPCPPAANDP